MKEKLPFLYQILKPRKIPLIVSISGDDVEHSLRIAKYLVDKRISALEINVSCPNIEKGLVIGSDPCLLYKLVRNLKKKTPFPLIVKLTPNVTKIAEMAKAAEEAGADILSLINTIKAMAYISSGPNAGQWVEGGLSGPVIKPIALAKIKEVREAVKLPLIGMGGIVKTEDVKDFFRLGVKVVAIGSATLVDPFTIPKIVKDLRE